MVMLDWRDLPRHPKRRAPARTGPARSVTLHFNGPAIPQARSLAEWHAHLKFIATFHMQSASVVGDGIQYHYAVLPGGEVAQTRDENIKLSHCGNATGNAESIAIHLPLGGVQRPSAEQWISVDELLDQLRSRHSITVDKVYGHRQWPRRDGPASIHNGQMPGQGECPGDAVMALLAEYRASAGTTGRYVVKHRANVREAPDVRAPIAWGGEAVLPVGFVIEDGTRVTGAPFSGDDRWLHLPFAGFVHFSALTRG